MINAEILARMLAIAVDLGVRSHRCALSARGAGDQCTVGLNFRTLRPRREIFADYRKVVERVYGIDAFYSRVRTMVACSGRT
jgi:hypothetical protein